MSMLRSYADGVSLGEWLNDYIWPAEGAHVGPEFCKLGAMLSLSEMIRCGVTCFSDMYFFPEETAEAVKEVGMRGVIGVPVIMFPNAWAKTPEEHLEKGAAFQKKYEDKENIFVTYSPHAPYTVDDGSFARIATLANENNMRVHTHLHETKKEVEDSITDHHCRPFERLRKLGLINSNLIAVHMTQLIDEEVETLAKEKVKIVHCPESNLKLGSGMCDVKALLDAGIEVGIGTDGAGSNDDQDVFGELRTAALVSAFLTQTRGDTPLHAHTFLEMATINNARILGIDHLVGSLEVGKKADIVSVHLRNDPIHDPVVSLVFVGTNEVTDVWVGGKEKVVKKEVVCVDEEKLRKEAQGWVEKIQATKVIHNGNKNENNDKKE